MQKVGGALIRVPRESDDPIAVLPLERAAIVSEDDQSVTNPALSEAGPGCLVEGVGSNELNARPHRVGSHSEKRLVG